MPEADATCEHPRTVDEGFWRICLDCQARWLPEVDPPPENGELIPRAH